MTDPKDETRRLHAQLAQLGFGLPDVEWGRADFSTILGSAITAFQRAFGKPATGFADPLTAKAIDQALAEKVYTISGTVRSLARGGVGGLNVVIVDKAVGNDTELAKTRTDSQGNYSARFDARAVCDCLKQRPDLQARVYADKAFVAASEVRYNAGYSEVLNVSLPREAAGLQSEHEALVSTLALYCSGKLSTLREDQDRSDITYLANKSGWDARAVAMASLADQLSQATADRMGVAAIAPSLHYALMRAGLPGNPEALYQVEPDAVKRVWGQALAQGIIPRALESSLPQALLAFQKLGSIKSLETRVVAGASTLRELLSLSLGSDPKKQALFSEIYAANRTDTTKLWAAVREKFGAETTQKLQLDGQLAFLTLNNAPVIRRLRDADQGVASALDLARRGYFRAEKWGALIDTAIPDQIPGSTPDERKKNYAEFLATQVRLSFPTAVVAERVRLSELKLGDEQARAGVVAFLTQQQGKFEIGVHPVEQYVTRNQLESIVPAAVRQQVKRLQRVYQITPDDNAMRVLLQNDLDSAYKIVQLDRAEFVRRFQAPLGGEHIAQLTFDKSMQVNNIVLNVVAGYVTTMNAPVLGSRESALVVNPGAPAGSGGGSSGVRVIPALETLFGSMDYCACSHCRSVLSPAAYLVDLLQFLSQSPGTTDPLEELRRRRPDIEHLPLTCENTNTPIPYIDVILETLEFFVAQNLSIAGYQGHDTDPLANPEESLASPRYDAKSETAYGVLKAARFPAPLPFDRDLEALRRYFSRLGVPLHQAMEVLRRDDAVERANAGSYGTRDILMERLGLNRGQHQLLTDRSVGLAQMYGFPSTVDETSARAGLLNAQAFTRRLQITYEELVALLRTEFVNPASRMLSQLERLHVPFATIRQLKEGTITAQAFEALLPTGAARIDPSEYDGNIAAWATNGARYAQIAGLITLTPRLLEPGVEGDPCSFENFELRYLGPPAGQTTTLLTTSDYVRILRFVMLWRKLGLPIEDTDKLIGALYPRLEDGSALADLDEGFKILLVRAGVFYEAMDKLRLSPKRDLLSLLSCFSTIDTFGNNSLYSRMFLSRTILDRDRVFARDSSGLVLDQRPGQGAGVKLLAQAEILRAAFSLSADELDEIVKGLGFDATTPLSLASITSVYRHGWLARKLRISARELLLLKQFTEVDPFALTDLPRKPLVAFIDFLGLLRERGIKPSQLLYLVWNADLSGASGPVLRDVLGLAGALRREFRAIDADLTVQDDPAGEVARARLTLVASSAESVGVLGLG